MERHALWRLEDHERSMSDTHLLAVRDDPDAAQPLLACGPAEEIFERACCFQPTAQRRAREVQVHAYGRKPRFRRDAGTHSGRKRKIGKYRKSAEVNLSVGLHAMRTGVHGEPRIAHRDVVERNVEKIADEVISGFAIERNAAQDLLAYRSFVCHVRAYRSFFGF